MIQNIFLRGTSALIKMLFLLYLGRVIGNEFVGEYSLIMSITSIALIFMGFEAHSGFGRIIHGLDDALQKEFIGSQLKFYIYFYVICIPVISYISLETTILKLNSSILLSIAICLDHFSLELYRILVTKIKPREAVLFHFVRNVPFILILLLLDFFKIIKITLDYFIIFWLISNIISIQSLFIRNKVLKIFPSFISIFKNTFTSFVKLLNDSKFYFFLAIFGTITSNIDKFILVKTIGLSNLGIYFTLLSLAAVVNIFISYSIGAHQGPQIVKDFSLSGFDYYIQKRSILIRDYIFYSTGASFVVVTCFYFSNLFQLTNYKNYLLEMSFILISVLISSVSEAFKIDIYVAKFDKKLFFINIIISSFSIINLIYFSNYFGLLGATIALVINSFVQFILFFLISKSALKNLASTRNSLM